MRAAWGKTMPKFISRLTRQRNGPVGIKDTRSSPMRTSI